MSERIFAHELRRFRWATARCGICGGSLWRWYRSGSSHRLADPPDGAEQYLLLEGLHQTLPSGASNAVA